MHHQILELQKKTHQNTSTKTLESLQEAANLIAQNPTISDSLKSENDYLIGYYYSNNGQVDSAATYYYKAIDRIKDSIKTIGNSLIYTVPGARTNNFGNTESVLPSPKDLNRLSQKKMIQTSCVCITSFYKPI